MRPIKDLLEIEQVQDGLYEESSLTLTDERDICRAPPSVGRGGSKIYDMRIITSSLSIIRKIDTVV